MADLLPLKPTEAASRPDYCNDPDPRGETIIFCEMRSEIKVFHNYGGEVSIVCTSRRGIEDVVSIPLDCVRDLAEALKSLVDASY